MARHETHCPFLNHADERCASNFRLDHLGGAFAQCFDAYATCPTYGQLLAERRARQVPARLIREIETTPRSTPPTAATADEAFAAMRAMAERFQSRAAMKRAAAHFVQVQVRRRAPLRDAA